MKLSLILRFTLFTLLLNILIASSSLAHQTIYIDPDYKGEMDGSISFPFNSWDSINWNDGDVYLQKAGTTFITTSGLKIVSKNNITLGSYGDGSKPKITGAGKGNLKIINVYNSQNAIITGFDLSSKSGQDVAGIIIDGKDSGNNLVTDCIISQVQWGVRILTNASGNRILNCIIYNTQDDGIFIKDVKDIEIGYCKIYNVNLKYIVNRDNNFATGDNIQIASSNNLYFNIHHNHLDHSYTGNKFCLIVWGINYKGVVEYNTMIGNSHQTSSCIYLSSTSNQIIVRYNTFKNGNYGIFSMAKKAQVFYNAFIKNNIAISIQDNSNLIAQNNTFYQNSKYAITSKVNSSITSQNNLFSLEPNSIVYFTKGFLISDYNFYSEVNNMTETSTLATWQKSNEQDLNSKSGDPQFVNPAVLDLTLMDDSPCIDSGINVGLLQDFFGTIIKADSMVDIGYHEHAK